MPHIQVQRGSTNKTVGGAQLCLESHLVPARDAWRVQTKPCAHQGPRERISDLHRRLWTCLWVCEYLLQRHGSATACLRDRGSDCSRPWRRGMWHKSSWRRLALAPPKSCQADNPQTGEQLYQRSSCAVAKVLEPTTDSPTCRSHKGTENPQGIWLWRPVGFDYRTSTGLGNRLLAGTMKLVDIRTQEKGAVTPQETEPDLPVSILESPAEVWVDSGPLRGQGSDYNRPGSPWMPA